MVSCLTQSQTAAAQQTQEETCGKKSSIGSENRQRCSRRFRTSVMVRSVPPRFDRVALKARRKILPSAPLYCVSCCVREEPSLRGGHGKSGSLIRSSALLPRSKLGTRHTPDDMYSPTRQPAKRCREQSLWRQPTAEVERAACAEIDMARRPSSRTMPLARACGSVEGSTARRGGGAPTAPLPHHSRTTPTGSGAAHMELRTAPVHRSRAQLGAGVGQVACSL